MIIPQIENPNLCSQTNHFFFFNPQAHGRNLLSIDFDRNTRTEKIYDDHRKFTLRIMYDAQGRPAMWLPSSSLAVVNVSYSSTGQLVGLQRGSMSERTEFDPQGRIVSRSFVDGKVWSYSYLDKVRTLWDDKGPYKLMLHVLFNSQISKSGVLLLIT